MDAKKSGDNSDDEDCRICSLFFCSVKVMDDIITYDRNDKLIKNETIKINLAALPIFKDKSQDNIINLSIIYLIIMIYGTQNMLYNDDLNILRKMISVLILL